MTISVHAVRIIISRLVAVLFLLAPATACAGDGATFRVTELEAEQRIVVLMRVDGSGGTVRLPVLRTALVHRALAEVVDRDGRPFPAPFVLRVHGGADPRAVTSPTMMYLTADLPEFTLPSHYGVAIQAGDSLTISADLPDGADVALRITLEYELPGRSSPRMPVHAVAASASSVRPSARVTERDAEWIVQAESDGLLLAIAGRQVRAAEELVVEDPETGAVLWRRRFGAGASRAGTQRSDIERPALEVREGRSYRLRARFASEEQRVQMATEGTPVALLIPGER